MACRVLRKEGFRGLVGDGMEKICIILGAREASVCPSGGRDERVTDPEGRRCPECGAPRDADNTPSCACTRRASEALRETRTAEAAAAEDFDPLRIRPYVELEGADAGTTMPLRTLRPEGPGLAATPAPSESGPSTQDVRLFEAGQTEHEPGDDTGRPRGRRRTVLLGAAGAVVAVVAELSAPFVSLRTGAGLSGSSPPGVASSIQRTTSPER
jgi:hypothetical protein